MPKTPDRSAVPTIRRERLAAMSAVMAEKLGPPYPVFKYMISAILIL
jgi:hypothetical protein